MRRELSGLYGGRGRGAAPLTWLCPGLEQCGEHSRLHQARPVEVDLKGGNLLTSQS